MINCKYSYFLLRLFSVLLVLSLSVSILCLSAQAAVDVGNGVTYTVSYKDEYNTWHDITSSGGAIVGYVSREYQVRFRFLMPSNMAINQPYDINLTLNHQQSVIENIGLTVLDTSGSTLASSACSWTSITQNHNSSYTRDYIGIYGFRCTTATWVTLSFSYYSTSASNPNGGNTGIISCGVTQFSITETSNDSLIIDFNQSVHNDFQDLIEQESSNTSDIINNQNEIASSVSDDLTDINDSIEESNDLLGTIGDGISDIFSSISDFFGGFFTGLCDAIIDLLVPDFEDLEEIVQNKMEDFEEDFPFLANLLGIFYALFDVVGSGRQVDHFTIPGFTIPLPDNNTWQFNSIEVPLFPSNLDYLLTGTRAFISICTSILVIRLLLTKVFYVMGFKDRDLLVDDNQEV